MNPGRKCIGYLKNNFVKSEDEMKARALYEVKTAEVLQDSVPVVMTNVDLEDALDLAGAGKYQVFVCALMLSTVFASTMEMIGIAFVLPAAACDLQLPDSLRGIITSIPNIGVILTAPFWGRASDSLGRKPVLVLSSAAAGLFGVLAAFMPGLVSFAVCKLAGSLFLSCPSSLCFAYACELMPRKRRDSAVIVSNSLLMPLVTLSPVFAWLILPYHWRYQLGLLALRPWRLLTVVYAAPLLLTALWMTWVEESPKFLVTKGRWQEALGVLKKVYSVNSGLGVEDYCVKSLKNSSETASAQEDSSDASTGVVSNMSALALVRPPHLKWLALTGFLMFGLFSLLNGLFLLAPDTINKVMRESSEEAGTICILMNQSNNATTSTSCVDSISPDTFYIMIVTTLIYGVLVTAISLMPITKKTMLVSMFTAIGIACLTSGLSTNRMVAGVAMSSLQITSLGIGPLTAYVVHLFPTSLRGTAVGAVLMFGRIGSTAGANAAGFFLPEACTATFYGFSLLLFLCAALSFLLPSDNSSGADNEDSGSR